MTRFPRIWVERLEDHYRAVAVNLETEKTMVFPISIEEIHRLVIQCDRIIQDLACEKMRNDPNSVFNQRSVENMELNKSSKG